MVSSEREMVRKLIENDEPADRFTSLQPTYEDSVSTERDWDDRDAIADERECADREA